MFGRKAVKVAGNRFLALLLLAAMAAGLVVPAGGEVNAAGSGEEFVGAVPSGGGSAGLQAGDGAPHIDNPRIYNDTIELGFTEGLVVAPGFHFQNGHFIVTVNGVPAETEFVAPNQTNDFVLIILKNRVLSTDVVKIRFDPGADTPVTNQAGYPLGTEEVDVTNTSTGLFQVPPEVRWPNKTGYDLKAGDAIFTFTPSRSGANNIMITFPNESGNATTLSNGNIAATDFKIRSGAASMQPRLAWISSDHMELYLPVGETLTGGVSYTLEMSGTAGGNEIKLPANETTTSTAYLAARLDGGVYDEYTFTNLAFFANVPPVVKNGMSVTLEEGGDSVSYLPGDLATDIDGDDLTLSGATSSDIGVAEAIVDVDGLLRINPVSPGNATVTVEVEDGNSHRSTATVAVIVTKPKTSALMPEDVQVKNQASGADSVTIQGVPSLAVVKVYDAPTEGSVIGTATQGAATGSLVVTIAAGIPGSKIYVTVQDITGNLLESARTEADVPAFVDKSILESWIDDAQEKVNNATEGDAIGEYEVGSKADLQAAIAVAVAVRDDPDATQDQVDPLISMMIDAVNVFDSRKIVADMSALIAKVGEAMTKFMSSSEGNLNGQYEPGARAELEAAARLAFQVSVKPNVSQEEVDEATIVLTAAIAEFDGKKIGAALALLLISAEEKLEGAMEGTGTGQYPPGSKEALQAAIDDAWAVADNMNATKAQVDAAVVALNAAAVEFETKKIVSRPNIGGVGGPSAQVTTIQLNVVSGGVVLGTLPLSRTTDANGRITDKLELNKDSASQWIAKLKGAGELLLTIPDEKDNVEEFAFTIPLDAAALYAESNLTLTFVLNGVKISIPASSLKGIKEAIKLKVTPIRDKPKRDEIGKRANSSTVVRTAAGNGDVIQTGTPVSIETNLQNRKVTLTLPRGTIALSEQQMQNTGIYVEHSDGTTELILPRKSSDGWEFDISKFSTFSIVRVEGWQQFRNAKADEDRLPYIKGYEGGLFKPNASLTRAELASILAKVIQREPTQTAITFKDVPATSWAKEAIDKVVKLGLMKGTPNGSFMPNKPITRAEIAVIAASIYEGGESNSSQSFTDVAGHWALAAIRDVSAAGILTGFKDGTFRPSQTLSRAEAVVLINRLIGLEQTSGGEPLYKDVPATHWAYGAIQAAARSSKH